MASVPSNGTSNGNSMDYDLQNEGKGKGGKGCGKGEKAKGKSEAKGKPSLNEDVDWGHELSDTISASAMGYGRTYDELRQQWYSSDDQEKYKKKIQTMSIDNASDDKTFIPWRMAWNGDAIKHESAVAALKQHLGDDLDEAASLASPPFGCAGVDGMGRKWGKDKGGGCTVFIASHRVMRDGKKFKYKFKREEGSDDGASLVMVADFWYDSTCGLTGKKMGYLVGDLKQEVFNVKKKNADLQRQLRDFLAIPGLRIGVKAEKEGDSWLTAVRMIGTDEKQARAIKRLRADFEIQLDGWTRKVHLVNSAFQAERQMKAETEVADGLKETVLDEIRNTDGRRVKLYQLHEDLLTDNELVGKMTEICKEYGELEQEPVVSKVTGGYNAGKIWARVIYSTTEGAEAANDRDSLAVKLGGDEFCDPEYGYVTMELASAEKEIKRMQARNVTALVKATGGMKVSFAETVVAQGKGNAEKLVGEADALVAKVLSSGGRAVQAFKVEVMKPSLNEMRIGLVDEVKNELQTFKSDLKDEVKNELKNELMQEIATKVEQGVEKGVEKGVASVMDFLRKNEPSALVPDSTRKPKRRIENNVDEAMQEGIQQKQQQGFQKMVKYLKEADGGEVLLQRMLDQEDVSDMMMMVDSAADGTEV